MLESIREKILDVYYTIVPYEWRPGQIWYRFKCWAFRPYTTIKPRYLPHTWQDKDHILVHAMFEILSLYIEKEKPGESIDWESDEGHSQAWKDINELYNWWHNVYVPWENADHYTGIEFGERQLVPGTTNHYRLVYSSPEAEERSRKARDELHEKERQMDNELTEKCKKLVEIRGFLWT